MPNEVPSSFSDVMSMCCEVIFHLATLCGMIDLKSKICHFWWSEWPLL